MSDNKYTGTTGFDKKDHQQGSKNPNQQPNQQGNKPQGGFNPQSGYNPNKK